MKKFGEYLKELRLERKLHLRDVEVRSGISNAYISQLENGNRGIPTIKTLKKLADAYDVSIESLVNFSQHDESFSIKYLIEQSEVDFLCKNYSTLNQKNKETIKCMLQYLQNKEVKNE